MTLDTKSKQFILEYMHQRDVPSWYCGTSPFQIEAADQLSNAIRDDTEQNTSHRVRRCLVRLGLSPAVHDKDLKILMRLCGGNDLAFLWFLMELYYKTKGDRYDSLNEQLILTSITHLDMITTLRELDRILPPGNASKRQMSLRRKQKANDSSWLVSPRKLIKKRSSPYFDQLERPRPYGKPLTLERPDFKVRFFRYDAYKDPNYVPPNEESRWYANHKFRTNERITKQTLRDCLTEIMEMLGYPERNYAHATDIIDYALDFPTVDRDVKILCKKHQMEEEEVNFRRKEFLVKKREKCLKNLEYLSKEKQARIENIRNMLEKDVEAYRLHCRKMQKSHVGDQSYIRVLGKEGYCEHYIKDSIEWNCLQNPNCHASPSVVSLKDFRQTVESTTYSNQELILPRRNRLSFGQSINSNTINFSHFNALTPPSSQRYFIRPTDNKPYHFDYTKLFNYKDENDMKYFIKDKCVEAMDKDPHNVPKTVDLTPDLRKVAKDCANETWNENEAKWRAEDGAKIRQQTIAAVDPYPSDMPRLPFYDCEDKDLMDRMLKIALCEMKKQPKFVLASLPDAYKIPMLREWISQRYGKRYTKAELLDELKMSIKVMNTLQNLKLRTILPKSDNTIQSYGCYEYIMKKVNMQRRQFYDRLNAELLKRTRYFWFAMRNSLSLLPQRQTFFAYLPARKVDNYLFKPWKTNEYMDAKSIFEQKRFKKSHET